VTLKSLGLHIQLGHGGLPCACPSRAPTNFRVFDTTGIHYVSVDYCDCRVNGNVHSVTQLLRARWFPATCDRPMTAFTFECLDTFHLLTLQGKMPLYDFYHTIVHKQDNLELKKPTVSFLSFLGVLPHNEFIILSSPVIKNFTACSASGGIF